MILAGDFNSTPDSNVVRLITGLPYVHVESDRFYTPEVAQSTEQLWEPARIQLASSYANYLPAGGHP